MQENYKTFSHLSLGILISIGLVACGGGSNTTEEVGTGGGGDDGGEAGSGGCVSFPRPVVGQKVKFELKNESLSVLVTTERLVTAINATSIAEDLKVTTSGITIDSKYTETFTIANNYRDITQSSSTTLGVTSVTTYAPYERQLINEVCEGQVLNSNYTETSTPGGEVVQRVGIFTVEAVNVPKTTAAGAFNTFRIKSEDSGTVGTSWVDISTGVSVFSEFEETNDPTTAGTLELIEIN